MTRRFRTSLWALALAVATAGVYAGAQDILAQFNLEAEEAHDGVFDSVWSGRPSGFESASSVFRRLSPEARAAAVAAAATAIRAYCGTADFRERYAQAREARRPIVPQTTSAAAVDKQMAEAQKALEQTQAAMANMPPEMRKMMEAMMKEAGGGEVDLDSQFAEANKDLKKGAEEQKVTQAKLAREAEQKKAEQQAFDKRYPADANAFIAGRLRDLLAELATIPDDAVLVKRSGSMVFADPMLESKSDYWKQLFRAGAPARQAARTAATSWLQAIEGKAAE